MYHFHGSNVMISRAKCLELISLVCALAGVSSSGLSQAGTGDSLTVESAVQIVLATNPAIQQAVTTVDASNARVVLSKSSLYPEAGISLNYVKLEPVAALSFPGFGNLNLFPSDNYDERIGASATIFDFNKREKGVDLAATQVESAKDKLAFTRQSLAYQTIQTFYSILFLRQSLQVQDEEINNLNEHLVTTRKKVESGSATDFDALTTEVRVAAAQNQKIGIANSLSTSEIALRRLLGVRRDSPLNLVGEFTEKRVSLNLDSLETAAFRNRVEMKAAADQIAAAQAQYQVASASDNPSLNVALAYGFKNGYEPNIYALRGNFAGAVQLQMPLSGVVPFFGGYRQSGMKEEAAATTKGAEAYRNQVAQQIAADVQKAVADLRTSLERLQTADITVQQAMTALNLARVRYDAGAVTNLDLLDAETALAQAKLTRLESLYRYVIGRYELERAVGARTW